MFEKYQLLIDQLIDNTLSTPGVTSAEVRQTIIRYVANRTLGTDMKVEGIPPGLTDLVDKVTWAAYSIEDQDIEAAQDLGYSDDAIMEVLYSAALGAGLARLQCAKSVFEKENENKHETSHS